MVAVTIDGAEDGKTGTADAGPDEAAQQQPTENKIRARGRRKGKRKRRRKTAAQTPTTDQKVDQTSAETSETSEGSKTSAGSSVNGSDGPETTSSKPTDLTASAESDSASAESNSSPSSDDSNQSDTAPQNETVSGSGDTAIESNDQKESDETAPEERLDTVESSDDSAEVADKAASDEEVDAEASDNDGTSDDRDESDAPRNDAELDTADRSGSKTQRDDETRNDEGPPADSLDGAYSTTKKGRRRKSSAAPTSDHSTSDNKHNDNSVTKDVADEGATQVEESAAKGTQSKSLDDEASKDENSDEDNTKQVAQDDGRSEPDTSEQLTGKPLTGERIDNLLSLVDTEPDEDDEASSATDAETASPPNIDDLFVGAIDKTENDTPSIDDLLPTESADKIEAADSSETTETSDSTESAATESLPSSEDATIVHEVAPTEELKVADKPSSADSELDEATTPKPSEPASPIVVTPSQPESPAKEAETSDTKSGTVADVAAPATTGSAPSASPVIAVPAAPTGTPPAPTAPPSDPASTPPAIPSDPAPTGEIPTAPKEKTSSTGLRVLKWAAVIAIVGYALLVAVWGIRVLGQQDKVASGVQIGETNIGGMTRDDLDLEIDRLEDKLSTDGLEVIVNDEVIDTNPSAMGVEIDRSKLTSNALEARRGGFVLFRPFTWLGQLGSTESIEIPYLYDSSKVASTTDLAIIPRLESPVEPTFKFVGTNLAATEGTSGITVDLDEIEDLLPTTIESGTPYQMELNPTQADPTVETEVVDELASEINALTEDPIKIRILSDEIEVEPKTMREWVVLNLDGDDTSWTFDNDVMIADLKPRFPTLGTEDQQARIEVIDGAPTIINASETVICCEAGVDALLLETLQADAPKAPEPDEDDPDAEPPEAPLRQAVFKPEIVGFDEGVAELEGLGIIEEVSTFTTKHPCCANRVKNIQRFAELMQGSIVRPGESISLNDTVGRRTTAKGFFSDGAIVNGELKKSVGGGVSQYATTFLNASFYSGVDITEYRSHSRYISRYPEGREATINFPSIDLEIYNDTDYGILIWNEWTDTSITVSFYSTKNAEVTDLPTRTTWNGQCRTVTTPRLVEYLDDKPDKEDEVFGYYFPGFNKRCDGSLINPPDDDDE